MHWWGGGWREVLWYSKSQTKWERLTSFSWVWWVRLRFSESPVSGGRRVKKLKERKKGINRVDFTPHSTIQSYGLALMDGQEGSFELTLIWVFEMATYYTVLAWRIPGMGKPGALPSMELQQQVFEIEEAQVLEISVLNHSGWNTMNFCQDAIKAQFPLEKVGLMWQCLGFCFIFISE